MANEVHARTTIIFTDVNYLFVKSYVTSIKMNSDPTSLVNLPETIIKH